MENQSIIKCPECGFEIDVQDVLSHQAEEKLKQEYQKKLTAMKLKLDSQEQALVNDKAAFEEMKKKENELFQEKVNAKVKEERENLEKKAKKKAEEELAAKIKSLEEENTQRKEENKILKQKEVDLLKKEAELKEKQEDLKLEMEKTMLERQKEIEEKAKNKERESFELERAQLQKQIDDTKKIAEDLKRKAEQGSMQLQGEVQELALEELLAKTYPFDKILEVPKGVRGADCIQSVINTMQQDCGTIVYESKRTKNFANDWIDKLKQDQVNCKADIAVLVTETYPGYIDRFGAKNGIWICGFHEVKSLSFVLREMLIKSHSVKISQENKGDKMELLYNYLTSNEFVQNIKRIVENYDEMINQLNAEKKAIHKIWALREKHIWVVQENISALFGSIKGIAGKELETSNVLELPDKQIEE